MIPSAVRPRLYEAGYLMEDQLESFE